MRRINICVVTGTRAEFGIWRPVLRGIEGSKKLRLQLLVTGMHLQKGFGGTVRDISAEGFEIATRVVMYRGGESAAESLARGTAGMAKAFGELKPDLVMVLGDRLEILAAAGAALACQIPLAHVHGGETAPGQWDEQIRHAVTKMAHLHFCATKKAGRRIEQMGEDPRSIHVVGAPALDSAAIMLAQQAGWEMPAGALLVLHPSSKNAAAEAERTRMVLQALAAEKIGVEVLGPNNDPGHQGILRAYKKARAGVTMSVPQAEFWRRLRSSEVLIGNSSAGILEAASFGVPVVNLGDRQLNRERNGNVIDVPWQEGERGIRRALRRAVRDKAFRRKAERGINLYGDGGAAARMVNVLERMHVPLSTTKRFYERTGER